MIALLRSFNTKDKDVPGIWLITPLIILGANPGLRCKKLWTNRSGTATCFLGVLRFSSVTYGMNNGSNTGHSSRHVDHVNWMRRCHGPTVHPQTIRTATVQWKWQGETEELLRHSLIPPQQTIRILYRSIPMSEVSQFLYISLRYFLHITLNSQVRNAGYAELHISVELTII
jgi:hypothetical protein